MKQLLKIAGVALLLTAVAFGQAAYNKDVQKAVISTSGQSVIFQNGIAALNMTMEYVVAGNPATATVAAKGCMRQGDCDSLDIWTMVALPTVNRKITGLYDYFLITGTWTGGTNPSISVYYLASSASSPSAINSDPCENLGSIKLSAQINVSTATTTQIVAASPGQTIYVCQVSFSASGTTPTAQFVYGTGSNCGTGQATLTGIIAPTSGQYITSSFGGAMFSVPVSNALCITSTGTTPALGGWVTYVQQ